MLCLRGDPSFNQVKMDFKKRSHSVFSVKNNEVILKSKYEIWINFVIQEKKNKKR